MRLQRWVARERAVREGRVCPGVRCTRATSGLFRFLFFPSRGARVGEICEFVHEEITAAAANLLPVSLAVCAFPSTS